MLEYGQAVRYASQATHGDPIRAAMKLTLDPSYEPLTCLLLIAAAVELVQPIGPRSPDNNRASGTLAAMRRLAALIDTETMPRAPTGRAPAP
ncbi:hypothetical protein E4T66_17225 [Sinimarinibacterium sp. CAU 1509]|uniref:hypothetical protein n=1 Tax=Sinimarinibacterium sp. CAU 1509 TaxID=2562283 RepID=UPI0010AD33BA|nr:hypothetical protein [Sinimarinibacterium sp. CAU 1509]TJY57153.1 hypothetical protein E4T66_17225 [Sinimarinibacterium sp. CAU 1509]